VVVVACADPLNLAFEESLRLALGMPIRLAVASPFALHSAIDRWVEAGESLVDYNALHAMPGKHSSQLSQSACTGQDVSTFVGQPGARQILRYWFWKLVEKSLSHPLIALLVVTIGLAAALAAT